MGRKNFLFANTPNGAESSAVMFSLIETAKENQLDPYRHLVYVLTTAPNLDQTQPDWVTRLLPANAPEQSEYRISRTNMTNDFYSKRACWFTVGSFLRLQNLRLPGIKRSMLIAVIIIIIGIGGWFHFLRQ